MRLPKTDIRNWKNIKTIFFKVITQEEDKFDKTIDQGLSILSDMKEKLKAEGKTILSGDEAFKLYDTYGFPMDLTEEILADDGISVDKDGFAKAMEEQRGESEKSTQDDKLHGRRCDNLSVH